MGLSAIKELRDERDISDWRGQTGSKLPYTGDKDQIKSFMTGESVASRLFGADADKTGDINRRVISEREAALNEQDPVSSRIKQGANAQTRAARAVQQSQGRNLSSQEQAQIQRTAEQDIADQLYKNKQSNLNAYARTGGNLASNQLSTIMGFGGLDAAGRMPMPPGGGGISVICTELHRQGYLSDEIMKEDNLHGIYIRKFYPYTYIGYMAWAPSVVRLMQKSKLFTKFISFFGVRWAKDMAGKSNIIGKTINIVGMSICDTIGRLKSWKSTQHQN